MNDPKLWRNLQASLLKYCNDLITNRVLDGFTNFNFDTHASLNQLPEEDLLGIAELSLGNDLETYEGTVNFVVCTRADDTYMERLNPVIDYLFDELRVGSQPIILVNEKTAMIAGRLTISNSLILPVATSKGRPVQVVSVGFALSMLVPP